MNIGKVTNTKLVALTSMGENQISICPPHIFRDKESTMTRRVDFSYLGIIETYHD